MVVVIFSIQQQTTENKLIIFDSYENAKLQYEEHE